MLISKALTAQYGYATGMLKHMNDCALAGNYQMNDLNDLTQEHVNDLLENLNKTTSRTTAKTYTGILKALLKKYPNELNYDFSKLLSLRGEKSIKTFLNENEIKGFSKIITKTDSELYVQSIFLIGCYTGARISDIIQFSDKNIIGNKLSYVSKKTHIQAVIPLKEGVRQLIRNIQNKEPLSLGYFNNILRGLCYCAGVDEKTLIYHAGKQLSGEKWKFVSSHTARRSFATNLYLRGCDIYDISRMMGHSSVSMTTGYIAAETRKFDTKTLEFFK